MGKKDFNWHTKCKENISEAYGTICTFKINNSGLAQVRGHAVTDGHKDKVNVILGTKKVNVISGTKK